MTKNSKLKVTVLVTQEDGSFWSEYKDEHGSAFSEGDNLEELEVNMRESLALFFSEVLNREVDENEFKIKFEYSLQEFFEQYKAINMTELAKFAGISPQMVQHYKKGRKYPSLQRANDLIEAVRKYGKKLLEAKPLLS